jgi:broad specificity phosphatase PhoE
MPSLDLIFETHATSLDNEAGLASGWFDVDLSALGERQAQELGRRRPSDECAAIVCSDLRRALRTEIAYRDRGVPIIRDPRLRECDYGALTRHPAIEIEAQRIERISSAFPDGESYEAVATRVAAWLNDATGDFDGSRIVVIGHRATFCALQHLLAGFPLRDAIAAPWRWQPGWPFVVRRP